MRLIIQLTTETMVFVNKLVNNPDNPSSVDIEAFMQYIFYPFQQPWLVPELCEEQANSFISDWFGVPGEKMERNVWDNILHLFMEISNGVYFTLNKLGFLKEEYFYYEFERFLSWDTIILREIEDSGH